MTNYDKAVLTAMPRANETYVSCYWLIKGLTPLSSLDRYGGRVRRQKGGIRK